MNMKQLLLGTLSAALLAGGAYAAEFVPSQTTIALEKGQTTCTFEISAAVDQTFAGIELGLKPSREDVRLQVEMLGDYANTGNVQTVKDGVLYFGFYSVSNEFQPGNHTIARITCTYSGEEDRAVSLDTSSVIRINEDTLTTESDTASAPFTVTLDRDIPPKPDPDPNPNPNPNPSPNPDLRPDPDPDPETPYPPQPEVKPEQPVLPELSFADVSRNDYFYEPIRWAVSQGITSGRTETTFAPNDGCTRAQAVTFLWRAAGCPAPGAQPNRFTDVPADAYFHDAVLWAVEKGITNGLTETSFAPHATCTRAQIVTFLWRSQGSQAAATVNPFVDVPADAYFHDAVLWAGENGVTAGKTATTFEPGATCTRGQIVTFLYRFFVK